ncbi:hypothetical protein CAEBREN_17469 [Caenorhabditis brenneri]|uniref:maleylacetoacetate isomerase n=1 Tax=Caenorhabditis brenneri TaxID=135651 RepID=G0MWR5_CAEBE|nr:hypothetical protein CAEBREN_17469 [Caenorhabditis brenneri]
MSKPILYSAWTSSCSSRVRIALALKKIDYEYHTVDIKTEEEMREFAMTNPAKKIPILKINGLVLTESLAIIEYLDEVYPDPPLLPKDAGERAHARAIAFHIASNIQPLQNKAIIHKLNEKVPGYGAEVMDQRRHLPWLRSPGRASEDVLWEYCVGDQITIADLNLPSIVYNATDKYNVDITPYPLICKINKTLSEIPEFQASEPARQPDAPKKI